MGTDGEMAEIREIHIALPAKKYGTLGGGPTINDACTEEGRGLPISRGDNL